MAEVNRKERKDRKSSDRTYRPDRTYVRGAPSGGGGGFRRGDLALEIFARDGLVGCQGEEGGAGFVRVDGIDEILGVALGGGVHVDLSEVQGGGDFVDDGDFLLDTGIGDAVFAGGSDPAGAADEEYPGGAGGLKLGDEPAVVWLEFSLVGPPVQGLGIVGAEHEDDDVGLGSEGGLEGGLPIVGAVAIAKEGGAVYAEIGDVKIGAEHALKLIGIGPAAGDEHAKGDAIADAGDFLSGRGGEEKEE
jgi:hypothetical protein